MSEAVDDLQPNSEEIKAAEARFLTKLALLWWDNEFSREKIFDRVDNAIEKNFADPLRSKLRTLRTQSRSRILVLDQAAVSRFIVGEVSDLIKPIAEAAGSILFRMIEKASQIPFVDYSKASATSLGSYVSLLRGLSMYAPRNNVLDRGSIPWDSTYQFRNCNSREPDRAVYPGIRGEDETFWVDVSAEAAEVATMVDALSAIPPRGRYMSIPRSWYNSIAESMVKDCSTMGLLTVCKTDLLALVRLVLVLRCRTRSAQIKLQSSLDHEKLDAMANAVIGDFGDDNKKEIDWPTWIEVTSASYPDFFTPLEEFFELLFDRVAEQQVAE